MMGKRILYIFLTSTCFLFFAMVLRPIQNVRLSQTDEISGIVETIDWHEGSKDIFIRLKNDPKRYYINRGLEEEGLGQLIPEWKDQVITIYPVRHWTPLDPYGKVKHIARVKYEGKIVFDEIIS